VTRVVSGCGGEASLEVELADATSQVVHRSAGLLSGEWWTLSKNLGLYNRRWVESGGKYYLKKTSGKRVVCSVATAKVRQQAGFVTNLVGGSGRGGGSSARGEAGRAEEEEVGEPAVEEEVGEPAVEEEVGQPAAEEEEEEDRETREWEEREQQEQEREQQEQEREQQEEEEEANPNQEEEERRLRAEAEAEQARQREARLRAASKGKGGQGLGKGGQKVRRRWHLRDNLQGITKPAIRRLARRGGVKRISGLIYEETRGVLKTFLQNVIKDAVVYVEHRRCKTVLATDVLLALKRQGRTLYGFGG